MALAYVIVAIASAAFAGKMVHGPYVDGDLFWQRRLGEYVLAHGALPGSLGTETFTAPGAPWTAQEWLLGVADALAVRHGALWVLAVAAALAVGAALLISIARARRGGASPIASVLALIALIVDLQAALGIRAQVFAWPLFAALLYVLDLSGVAIFWAIPLVVVWANVHASAIAAVPVVWLDALASAYVRGFRSAETGRRLLLAAIVPFATMATPLGVKLPEYALALVRSPIRQFIDEWQPVGRSHYFFWFGAVPMLIVVVLCARALWRLRPRDLALGAILAVMTVQAVRNGPLLGFVLMPMAATALDRLLGRFAFWKVDPLRSPGPRRLAIFGGAALAALAFVVGARGAPGDAAWSPALDAFAKLSAMGGERRLFCYDFAVCSPALDFPGVRVYMDGRADPYPPQVWFDFNTLRYARPGWSWLADRYRIDAAYVKRGDKLDAALTKRRDWRRVATAERCCRLYVRRPVPTPPDAWWFVRMPP